MMVGGNTSGAWKMSREINPAAGGERNREKLMSTTVASNNTAGLAGKHLTFILGQEYYAVPVLKIREIIRLCTITPMPQMPDYIKGVLNMRGKIVPVADLRMKFNLPSQTNTELTCIVMMQISMPRKPPSLMGVIVDAVEEVIHIPATDIEPPPDIGTTVDENCILGVAKAKGTVKMLLDIDRVFVSTAPSTQ